MKKITAIFFLSVIMIFMCLVCARVLTKAGSRMNSPHRRREIDWAALYPFAEGGSEAASQNQTRLEKLRKQIETYTSEKLIGYERIVELGRKYEDIIGWNVVSLADYNPVIRLNDGHLIDLISSKDVSENALAVEQLNLFCRELGIDYIYINYPEKVCVSEDRDISGILDYSNQNADRFLKMLRASGVRYYDFRKFLHDEGMSHHGMFFVADFHWKPEFGLWAARHILRILSDDYGWEISPSSQGNNEILSSDNFNSVVYPEYFLGGYGRKLTLARANPEDFTLLYPKFRTLLHLEASAIDLNVSGDFSIMYDMRQLERKDYYELSPYSAYKYGDQPLSRIHNLLSMNGKKLLIIHDSMSDVVIPFIALGIEYVDMIDLRQFTGSLRNYIESTKPDMVITAYNTKASGMTKASRKPNNKIYDFR